MEKKLKDNDLEKVTGGGVGTDPLGRDTNPAFKNNNYINYGTCTTCGMPLLADKGTTLETCPFCGENIVEDDPNNNGQQFNQKTI